VSPNCYREETMAHMPVHACIHVACAGLPCAHNWPSSDPLTAVYTRPWGLRQATQLSCMDPYILYGFIYGRLMKPFDHGSLTMGFLDFAEVHGRPEAIFMVQGVLQ
jgi:hypothetical protein